MSKMISMVKRKSKHSFVKEIEVYPHSIKVDSTSLFALGSWVYNTTGKIFRFVSKHTPSWLQKMTLAKTLANRPQVAFLPRAEDMGTAKALAQPSSIKTSYFRCPVPV